MPTQEHKPIKEKKPNARTRKVQERVKHYIAVNCHEDWKLMLSRIEGNISAYIKLWFDRL
jgi:hypothetical protein